jgi:hypothetical protein
VAAISWKDRKAIENWVMRMAQTEFDPSSTISSIDVPQAESCSAKDRFEGTSEAILALIRIEKRDGRLIKQLPYYCKNCKGVHNSHLISRQTLSKLVLKYQPRTEKRKVERQITSASQPTSLKTKAQPPQTWKNCNLELLLKDLVQIVMRYLSDNFGVSAAPVKNFDECLDLIGYPSAFQVKPDPVEANVLWLLFYAFQYRDELKNQVPADELMSLSKLVEDDGDGKADFQKRILFKYFSGQSLFDGLCHVAEKCAGLRKYDWVRLNSQAKLMHKHSKSLYSRNVGTYGPLKVDPSITKASCSFETNGYFDKIFAAYSLDNKDGSEDWKPVKIKSDRLKGKFHSIELRDLTSSSNYILKVEFIQLNGEFLRQFANFKTKRLPDTPRRVPSDSGRNTWPVEALPPGGGALRRRNGN